MTYDQAIEYIHSVYWRGSKLGLERATELLSNMGNPQNQLRFVHVAGTNGKGSVCAMLSFVLKAQGYRTGLYISPYLERFNERMQIDNCPIPDRELAEATAYVRSFAEDMRDPPTEFEVVCAIAFEWFARKKCDVVVLEVGLGGRLDATNVIAPPLCTVITSIDYDHTEYLGDTIEKIALEKAGIVKRGSPVVSYKQPPKAAQVIQKVCREKNADLIFVDFSKIRLCQDSLEGQILDYGEMQGLHISLLGAHQQKNAAVVCDTALVLNQRGLPVSEQAIREGLAASCWPGRFEVLRRKPVVVVDGGHNPQGARAAAAAAKRYLGKGVLLLAILADKDRASMIAALDEVAHCYVATQPDNPRALSAGELALDLKRTHKAVYERADISAACALALTVAEREQLPVLAVGSLYAVGEIRRYFLDKEQNGEV